MPLLESSIHFFHALSLNILLGWFVLFSRFACWFQPAQISQPTVFSSHKKPAPASPNQHQWTTKCSWDLLIRVTCLRLEMMSLLGKGKGAKEKGREGKVFFFPLYFFNSPYLELEMCYCCMFQWTTKGHDWFPGSA